MTNSENETETRATRISDNNNTTKKRRLVGGLQENHCKRATVGGGGITEVESAAMEQPLRRGQCW